MQAIDHQKEIQCTISGEIIPIEDSSRAPHRMSEEDVDQARKIPEKVVRQFCLRDVRLHDLYFNTLDRVIIPVKEQIEDRLKELQFSLYGFSLEIQSPPYGAEYIRYNCNTKHDLFRKGQIEVASEALIKIRDAAIYEAKDCPVLTQWFETAVAGAINEGLHNKHYIDLVLDWDEIEERIRGILAAKAEEVGCAIKSLHAVPDLPARDLLQPFDLELKDMNFETNRQNATVKLDIQVTCRIPDLRSIEEYLHHYPDPKVLMLRNLEQDVRRFFLGVEPEEYYMRFEVSPFEEPGQGVEQVLRERLEDRCEKVLEPFEAEVRSVIIRRLDTEVSDCLKVISKCPSIQLDVPVKSVEKGSLDKVSYNVELNVGGVDKAGWHTFQYTLPTVDDIKKELSNSLRNKLESLREEELIYDDVGKTSLIKKLNKDLVGLSTQKFGLSVALITVGRQDSFKEQKHRSTVMRQVMSREAELKNMLEALETKNDMLRGIAADKAKQAREMLSNISDLRLELLKEAAPEPALYENIEKESEQAQKMLDEAEAELNKIPGKAKQSYSALSGLKSGDMITDSLDHDKEASEKET